MTTCTKSDSLEHNDIIVKSGLAEFTRDIKLGKFERSYHVAKRTIVILNDIIKQNEWSSAKQLIAALEAICAYIDQLDIVDTAPGNMTRRVLRIVRDEMAQMRPQQDNETSASDNVPGGGGSVADIDINKTGVRENIIEAIEQELINELELSNKSIAQQAMDYVQSDEIILTLGKSKVIEAFLRNAAVGGKTGRRRFTVVVVELAPFYSGREMAKSLNKHGISTLIIPDSAVFAIMSRVNKVIIGVHSMMANGGIKAPAGAHSIALAAKHYAVPLIVCCPLYKLTPSYLVSHDPVAFKQFSHLHAAYPEPYISPAVRRSTSTTTQPTTLDDRTQEESSASTEPTTVPSFSGPPKATVTSTESSGTVEAIHSTFDHVQPELITLFVSNIGGNSPSYVYQLLNELYCKTDYSKRLN